MSKGKPSEEFNVQAIIDTIDRCLAAGDSDGAKSEIDRPWPGMDGDIGVAVHELMSELLRNGTAPLFMKDMQFDDSTETVTIVFPDWFNEAKRVFGQRYPDPQEAGLRFQKTMSLLQHRLLFARGKPEMRFEELADELRQWLPADWPANHSTRVH